MTLSKYLSFMTKVSLSNGNETKSDNVLANQQKLSVAYIFSKKKNYHTIFLRRVRSNLLNHV